MRKFFKDESGETTLGSVVFALVFVVMLMLIVNISLFLFTALEIYHTKNRAERAMAIQGGLNPVVTQLITDNLTGKVDLSRLTVTATPYPVNSGGTYSITIHYDYPFGSFTLTGSTSHYSILTLPINSRAVGMSEAVIR